MKPTIIFFGSFQHYSTKVLRALVDSKVANISAVITTPSPAIASGDGGTSTYAQSVNLPILSPTSLTNILPTQLLEKYVNPPDFFIVAGYGQILPKSWLDYPKIAPLNLHFSLLPKYRGANPAEWAILSGEKETGVTLIKMDSGLDTGPILMQQSLHIEQSTFEELSFKGGDTRETLYEKLYSLAGSMIVSFLQTSRFGTLTQIPQPQNSPTPYAKRLTRQDGYIAWNEIVSAMQTGQDAALIERKTRALSGYPGVWTIVKTPKGEKRLKILSTSLVNSLPGRQAGQLSIVNCQLEGLNPSTYNQIKNQLL